MVHTETAVGELNAKVGLKAKILKHSQLFNSVLNCILTKARTNDASADQAGSSLSQRREHLLDDI